MKKLFPILLLLLFISCESSNDDKAISPIDNTAASCLLTSYVWDDEDNEERYYYDGEGKVIKYEWMENGTVWDTYTMEYDAQDRLIKVSGYDNSNNEPEGYRIYSYNNNGQIIKEENDGAILNSKWIKVYEYNPSGELSKFSFTSKFNNYYMTFEHKDDNISRIKTYIEGKYTTAADIEYDNKHFMGVGSPSYLTMGNFLGFAFPIKHNIVRINTTDAKGNIEESSFTATYEYNDKGFPIKAHITHANGTTDVWRMQYQCK